ncbi:hypothetical protein CRG98_014590 [Punica granatum]|uniref:Uncharacterized protein n=1 Tax=Punica granatum TaxID=22663 RepID=A0A2I0K8Y9_PUNGR|nr:hypothetical protein CRG98_014590 [Punica granatum]
MLDDSHRVLGRDAPVVVFSRDASIICECCRWAVRTAVGSPAEGWCYPKRANLPEVGIAVEAFAQLARGRPYRMGGCSLVLSKADLVAGTVLAHEGYENGVVATRGLQFRIGHAWAYRDVLNNALVVLSIVQCARWLWTLLNKIVHLKIFRFRHSGLDYFVSQVCKGEGFGESNLQINVVLRSVSIEESLRPQCMLCALEFHLLRACIARAYATRLGSVHLPRDTRRTCVRRSRHLPFLRHGGRGLFVEPWWSIPYANRDRECLGLLISR